jgi:hypothetical protein
MAEEVMEREIAADTQDTTLTVDAPITIDKWKETIPEDLRRIPVIEQTKDITSMAKQLINAQKALGGKIKIPADGDTAGWDDVYNKLGRPESVDKYNVTRPEVIEGIEYDDKREKSFLETAHKLGLNNSQVNALINWNQEQAKMQLGMAGEAAKDAVSTLKGEWGKAFAERLAITERLVDKYGGDEVEVALRDNPALIKFIYEMGHNLIEGTAVGDGRAGFSMSPQEAINEINRKMRDPDFMKVYTKGNAFGHADAVEEMKRLNEMAYPEPE